MKPIHIWEKNLSGNGHQQECGGSYSIEPVDHHADLHPHVSHPALGVGGDGEDSGENHGGSVTVNQNLRRGAFQGPVEGAQKQNGPGEKQGDCGYGGTNFSFHFLLSPFICAEPEAGYGK